MALSLEIIELVKRLSIEDTRELMRECAYEQLGIVSIEDYNKIMGIPKRTIYAQIKKGKLLTEDMAGKIGIILNDR